MGIQKREFHTHVKANKRIGPHNEDVVSVIIGSLLGNSITNSKPIEGTRIVLRSRSMEYLQSMYNFFYTRGYTRSEPRLTHNTFNRDNQNYPMYEFNTFTFRSFN